MKAIALIAAVAALLFASLPAYAQTSADSVTFGNRLSMATIASALQSSGYQALATPLAPTTPPTTLGIITTGINGMKVTVIAQKCPNATDDQICSLAFVSGFNDDKRIMDPALAEKLNEVAFMSKTVIQHRTNGTSGFTIVYTYPCKDFEDTKFISMVLTSFGVDVVKILTAYNAPPTTAATPANR